MKRLTIEIVASKVSTFIKENVETSIIVKQRQRKNTMAAFMTIGIIYGISTVIRNPK